MQQGQVSVWVPIIVGVIGLISVIAGQLINAWREDRRWKRDQEREEVRSRRQREADAAKRAHEILLHWADRKFALYSELLDCVHTLMRHTVKLGRGPVKVGFLREWEHLFKEVSAAEEQVRLVASKRLRQLVSHNIVKLEPPVWADEFQRDLGRSIEKNDAWEELHEEETKLIKKITWERHRKIVAYHRQLTKVMRDELGTNTEKTGTGNHATAPSEDE
ncbi:hypothetical protein [Amycolatopsis taiwanensis]|uniref:Uncharacterized protein n=1 Tax=Amycolatopsis taiwanensis TaxID=342230 RepID=A0A9W6R2I8_9PSEU|nr:hypothetical protein [Amycolatopsis taiwanensis]GLY67288.1 hypothetical protein Atai01_39070 [Amycolatopsis taiwanensis]